VRLESAPHPIGKLFGIGHGCRQENNADMIWKHNNDFFPYHSTLLFEFNQNFTSYTVTHFSVVNIMNLIENDKFDVSNQISSLV
jgi:uncharacterized protein YcgI (DUF1989 family)